MKSADSISESAKIVLNEQAKAISELAQNLPSGLPDAVRLISQINQSGRLICLGVGKASYIAGKISATFASLGLASFFVHPSEAAHGDLGRITINDLVLAFSNSGQTLEILQILPQLKQNACKIIAVTGNPDSDIAKASDVVLEYGKIKESDPLGVAPTTSTTIMLALGDALVRAVFAAQEVTAEQFARNHPGGAIGRNLMPVSQAMRQGEYLCKVSADLNARDVLHKMTETKGRPGCAVIVDSSDRLLGFFTDGDLRRCLEQSSDFLQKPIADVMSKNPKTISSGLLVEQAISILTKFRIDQVVVCDNDNIPVGVLDIQDVFSAS